MKNNKKIRHNVRWMNRLCGTVFIVLAIFLLLPVAAEAAIVIGTVKTAAADGTSVINILSVNISGSNRALVVAVLLNDNDYQLPSSVVIDPTGVNIPLTWLDNAAGNYQDDGYCRIYGVVNPPTGTFTVQVTATAATQSGEGLIAGAWPLTGVDQASPFRTAVGNGGTGTMKVTVTSAIGDMVLAAGFVEGYYSNDSEWCEGEAGKEDWDLVDGPLAYDMSVGQSKAGAATSTTFNWTYDSFSGKWVTIGVAVRPAGTTIGDGTSPANKDVAPDDTNKAVNAFTLSTNSAGTIDTVTALTVTFSGTAVADVASSGVKIYDDSTGGTANEWDAADTLKGTASFSGSTASFTGLSISVDSTATQYLVTYNIATGATDTNTLLGSITAATVSNILTNSDTTDATLTVSAAVKLAGSWVTGTTHAEEAGSDRVLILVATIAGYGDDDCYISSASYGTQPLTFIESRSSQGNYDSVTEVWYLNEAGIAAASGSTFSVTWANGPTGERYMSGFYTGVNQTTPIGQKAENFADAATPNPITTSALSNGSGDMVIVAAGGNGRGSYTAQNGFTEQQEDFWDDADDDCLVHTVADKAATGSAETPSIQHTGMYSQQIIGFVLQVANCTFSYRKPIIIDNTEVFGSSNHENFPMLVSLSGNWLKTTIADAENGRIESDLGHDIIFRDTNLVQLDHEIEKYDGSVSGGTLVAWVRIPILDYDDNTTIYMYYGNSCINSSLENITGVWNDDYAAVWHLSQTPDTDGGTDEILDSNNSNHGDSLNMEAGDQTTDRINGVLNFDGTDEQITIVANSALDLSTNFTVSAWFYKNTSGAEDLIYSSGTTNTQYWTIRSDPADKIEFNVDGTGGWASSTAIGTGAWHHMTVVKAGDTGTNMSFYVDGEPNGTATVGSVPASTGQTRAIGYRPEGNDFYWAGKLDEIRVLSTARLADWIKTCYYNQKASSTFFSVDPEEDNSPTVVDLISFTATGQDESVLLEWETAQEIDNLGFNLYRSSDPGGSYTKLNSSLIPGLISSVSGQQYTHIDKDVTRDVLYYYMLEDVELSGTRTMHGPVCVDWDGDGIPDGDVEDPDDDEDEDTDDGPEVRIPELRFEKVDFGPEGWTPSSSYASWVKLSSFRARQGDEGIALEWETSFEVGNFGFHVYREVGGKFYRITPDLVPGSVFKAGAGEELPAGQSYMYWDGLSEGTGGELYWLDCVELNGGRASFGPIKPEIYGQPVSKRLKVRFRSIGKRQVSRARELGNIRALREELSTKPVQTQSSTATFRMIDPETPSEPRLPPTEEQWLLAAQPGVKIYIMEDGWYRVGKPELVAAGLSPEVDPRYLQLYADGEEKSMMVTGSDDGRFDPLDAVEFYGTGLDTSFTAAHVYWLVVGSRPGRRVDTPFIDIRLDLGQRMRVPRGLRGRGAPLSFPFSLELKERTFYFAALKNGERENFFGSVISTEPVDQLLTVAHPDLSSPEDAVLEVVLQGATDSTHQIKIMLNYVEVGELGFSGQQQGAVEIYIADLLLEGDNIVTLTAQGGATDVSLVDYVRLTYWRTYMADEDFLQFKTSGGEWVSIGGFSSSEIQVVDITDPMRMINIRGKVMTQDPDYAITFKVPGAGERTLLAFTEESIKAPAGIEANLASSWHEISQGSEVIIIGHKDLLESVEFLKQLREQQGWSVVLVDVEDLYDEFNFGSKNPWALKDFLDRAYAYWNPQPRFVLLVGDASYDPRNYLGFGEFDLVPTKFVDTANLSTASDDWFVDFDADGLPEMAMGRLPVESAEEAETVVSKIIAFEGVAGLMNETLLVADINDYIDFEGASADIAGELLAGSMGVTEILRGQSATARTDLLDLLNQGQLLVNYVGHGSTQIWNGSLLTSLDAWNLTNSPYLPFLVSMTCLNGFFQDPYNVSLAETFLKAERGGAVAVWTSSGLTLPEEQAVMNQELIRLLFNGEGLTIGEAVMRAKQAVDNQDIRRTWILFGDPTLRLR